MRTIKLTHLCVAIAACTFSTHSIAFGEIGTLSNFSYDYVDARIGINPVVYGAGASVSIHPNAHIRLNAESKFESDINAAALIGFHAPINDWADIYGEVGARAVKQKGLFRGNTKAGVQVDIGIRQWLGPQIEVGAEIGHLSVSTEKKVFGAISARFHATELFSVGISGRFNDVYDNQVLLTARFKF